MQSIEQNNGEGVSKTMEVVNLPSDVDVKEAGARIVDVHCHDEGAPNKRAERVRAAVGAAGDCDLELLCLSHKKAQTNSEVRKVIRPADSHIIRCELSMQGGVKENIYNSIRALLREKTTLIREDALTTYGVDYMAHVLDTFLPGSTGYDRCRRWVIGQLFYGVWHRSDRYRIVDRYNFGLDVLVHLLCTIGIRALLPRRVFRVLQRNNWTGSDQAVAEIGLPIFIFNLFTDGYCRASIKTTYVAGRHSLDGLEVYINRLLQFVS